jgi:DNA-binding PadR family transcriptional regulator
MTEEQRARLFQDEEYAMNYAEIQGLVQQEILNLVKGRIESTEKGRELLNSQLKIIKKLKSKIIDDTNREMEMFKKFKEFSKTNPTITYDEFIKANL